MKTEKMFEINEEVMIKVKVVNMEFKNGGIWYQLKDNTTGKVFDYLFARKDIIACDTPIKKTAVKKTETANKTAVKKTATATKTPTKTATKRATNKK